MATTDVMTYAKAAGAVNATLINNGSALAYVDKEGNIGVIPPVKNHSPSPDAVAASLAKRFDDINYYTT